jgi:hypothetical protein
MTEAISYQEIKNIILSYYWRGCRDHVQDNWTTEQVCAWTYNELENSFDLAIENLMLEVIFFALTSGLQNPLSSYHKKSANEILSAIDLQNEISKMLPQDVLDFKEDLIALAYI